MCFYSVFEKFIEATLCHLSWLLAAICHQLLLLQFGFYVKMNNVELPSIVLQQSPQLIYSQQKADFCCPKFCC